MQTDLAGKEFWNKLRSTRTRLVQEPTNKGLIFVKECLYFSYCQYEFFFKIFPKYLNKNQRILEIGSSPGRILVLINRLFGSKVFGIENNYTGFKQNQALFSKNGLNKNNIYNQDFFKFKPDKPFDVVLSFGFIEHFSNPKEIIRAQAGMIKDNGLIICIIPNFSKINYSIQKKLRGDNLDTHNLDIMKIDTFEKLFSDFDKLYLGYVGIFSLRIFRTDRPFFKIMLNVLKPLRLVFNPLAILFSLIFDTRKISSGPFLIYIGSKK